MRILSSVLICACLLSCGCSTFRRPDEQPITTAFSIDQITRDMIPLYGKTKYKPTPAIDNYLRFYGLAFDGISHRFGSVTHGKQTLAVHVFIPPDATATVYLIHGFLDHTATLKNLINACTQRGYAVVVYDLPGHGLSSGISTETGDFGDCAVQLSTIVERTRPHLPKPHHLIAHSTGCSIAIEHLYQKDKPAFEKVVFLAPLVRHKMWHLGTFGYFVGRPFKKRIPRRRLFNSSDTAYLDFVRNDPLVSSDFSVKYLDSLYDWYKRVKKYPAMHREVVMIQGDTDKVVDWTYNLKFLSEKFKLERRIVPGARHQLLNESKPYRSKTLELIIDYLNAPPSTSTSIKTLLKVCHN